MEYMDDEANEMDFTDQDDEERSKNKQSIFDKILRKNSTTGAGSMPVNTRISELSNMANISQEELVNMSAGGKAKRPAESSGMHSSYSGPQTSGAIDGADLDSTFNATRESNEGSI